VQTYEIKGKLVFDYPENGLTSMQSWNLISRLKKMEVQKVILPTWKLMRYAMGSQWSHWRRLC